MNPHKTRLQQKIDEAKNATTSPYARGQANKRKKSVPASPNVAVLIASPRPSTSRGTGRVVISGDDEEEDVPELEERHERAKRARRASPQATTPVNEQVSVPVNNPASAPVTTPITMPVTPTLQGQAFKKIFLQ